MTCAAFKCDLRRMQLRVDSKVRHYTQVTGLSHYHGTRKPTQVALSCCIETQISQTQYEQPANPNLASLNDSNASEGEQSADEADVSAGQRPSVVAAPFEADGGAAEGYAGVPQVERAVAVHLCPRDTATWRGHPCLPSKACRLSSALAGRAYCAAGQAATALHAMATLQVYQAKALKELHKGSPDQAVMQVMRAATDFALRATKVTARSLGQVMSTLVVQERHLWLNLTQMADVDKARFLDAPVSQAGLFGDTVEDFAQQFSAVQKQTEAIKHILPRRETTRKSPGAQPQTARRRGRPPVAPKPTPSPAEAHDAALAFRRRGRRRGAAPPAAQDSATKTRRSPTHSQKEQFSTSLGLVPRDLFLSDAMLPRVQTRSTHSPAREPGKKVSAAQCSQTFLQDVFPSGISPLSLPAGCPTAVTSVNAPLIPLAVRLGAWLELPSPSRWLIRTVRLGYAIQFTRRPPKFRGVLFNSVRSDTDASVLRAEIAVLLAKDTIEPVPPAEMKSGFYSPLLHRAQEERWDWFAAIDLKDAYFHVSILPRHRPFLWFPFEGQAYQYKVLPIGLSLSPCVFTKVAEGALTPLWQKGIRILNYFDDWLIIAHSRDLLCEHRDLVLRHLSHLGLRVNREKSKLSPAPGLELDLVNMTACLTNERTQSVLNCLKLFRHKTEHNRSHTRRAQPCSRSALTAAHPSWRMATPPPDSPADLESILRGQDRSVCLPRVLPLPALLLPQQGSPRQGRTGTQLAFGAQVHVSPSEPPCTDPVQDQGGQGAGSAGYAVLAHPDLVCRPHAPRGSPSLEDSPEEGPSFSGDGHNLAPAS
ncbi:Gag-Pol polyprotein [Labeo rohita]|uniref:ribonuclease H n=1 Tax=Labeo rohita TaxID=84645 RepID=A0ABQ8LAK1_LABRO|nr:Gag-Pol polyprotein [Labeo rohita]